MTSEIFSVRSHRAGAVTAVDAVSGRSFSRHSHDEFGVGLITGGAQKSWSGRGQVEAVSGNIITVNPAELHDGSPIGPLRSWSMLYFSQRIVISTISDLEEGGRASRELRAPVIDDQRLAGLFIAVRETITNNEEVPAFEEQMLELFGELLGAARRPKAVPTDRLLRVRQRIDDAPAEPHSLIELAALAGLDRYQTVRGFARMTGLTPHAYLVQRRLDMARRLIRQGSCLAEAALEAGFADQSHMHRIFMARHGFTPGAFASAFRGSRAISFKRDPAHSH
jgi:AraC-like DNA-binding protein